MRDEWFIRGEIPMTKSEVRAAAVSKLELSADSVLYDIGAGTGSVSIEAARLFPKMKVFAVEKKPEAVRLILRNKEKFSTENVSVVEGEAPAVLKNLETPTHAFIGGTSGQMEAILDSLTEKNRNVRVVMSVIALESLSGILAWLGCRKIEAEIVQISVARAKEIGKYHMMTGLNPVCLISFGGDSDGK